MIQYLTSVLGLRYWPRHIEVKKALKVETFELPEPSVETKLLFLFLDSDDTHWTQGHELLFSNLVKAMGLRPEQIWKSPVVSISLVDYLNRLRQWNCQIPTVILSSAPDLSVDLQQLGSQSWIEIYSVSQMMRNPGVKKMAWKKLQLLLNEGLVK